MSDKFVEDHEAICDRCGGVGSIIIKYHSFRKEHIRGKCPKCQGIGKLDWVERIVGKKPSMDLFQPNSTVQLYHEGNKIIETIRGGFKVYG